MLKRFFHQSVKNRSGSNAALAFPCIDASELRTKKLAKSLVSGPEPSYDLTTKGVQLWHSRTPLHCDYGGILPEYEIGYESWGKLSAKRDNVILLHTGLSASSHARSTPENGASGWWQKYIGPGAPLDTDRFHVICTNVLGGCFGSTGPSSLDPADGKHYATRFPIITIPDMVRAQFALLDALGIEKVVASVGSSMGGMQCLAASTLFPERVGSVISISGCAKSHPYSIALRHTQRQVLMADQNWHRGFYYDSILPHVGMKLARQIATITYRSGPEWEERFGSRRADVGQVPAFCPDFLVETYLDHAGEKFVGSYDPNSLLYISKAMDLFNLSYSAQNAPKLTRRLDSSHGEGAVTRTQAFDEIEQEYGTPTDDLIRGLESMRKTPTLVIGVQSDNLMPVSCQREIADSLKGTGNTAVQYSELSLQQSKFGHDTFLLSDEVGRFIKEFFHQTTRATIE